MKPITAGLPPSTNWPSPHDDSRDTESRPYGLTSLHDPTHPDTIAANQEHAMKPPSSRAGKTREQVRAELAEAKAAGLVTYGEQDYPPAPPTTGPGKTREQVRAELAEAKAAGLVTYGEQDYPPTPPTTGPGKTREQVRAELAEAKAAGLVTFGEQDYPPTPAPSRPGKLDAPAHPEAPDATRTNPGQDDAERDSILGKLRNAFKSLWGAGQ